MPSIRSPTTSRRAPSSSSTRITGATVAGGVISTATKGDVANASAFKLTRELLERGLCRDLGDSDEDRREFQRRASEAALLLHAAGIPVKIEL